MRIFIISKKIIYTLMVLIILAFVITIWFYYYNRIDETFKMDIYYKGNVDGKIVSIACNVDWGDENIIPMLEILSEHNTKITFFVTGIWASKNPEMLCRIHNAGHEIGNHGYRHINYDKLDYEGNREQILKAHNVIYNILDIKAEYFAPPSGAYNDNTIKAAKDLNYDVIMWSIDTIDRRHDSTEEKIMERITNRIHNSAIILIHPTIVTVKSLPKIIAYLVDNGYRIGTIRDIIK